MTIGERIRERRIALGMTQEQLAIMLGYKSRTSINKLELDARNLTQSKIKAIADALETVPAYIMGWTEDPTWKRESDTDIKISTTPDTTNTIPLLGRIACGAPILAEQHITQRINLPKVVAADFALTCHGDSMIGDHICDGDTVFIRQQPTVENGEIAAVLIGEEATLKHVYLTDNTLTLIASNSAYQPIVLSGTEIASARILGKAVWVIRRV